MLFKPKFVYHKKLESHVWDSNNHMRPDVRSALLILVNQILNEVRQLNLPFDQSNVCDIFVHGSITNYYYNKDSDIDVCIVCDFRRLEKIFSNIDISAVLKNITHALFDSVSPIICKRHIDIEFVDVRYPKYAPGVYKAGGAYSLLHNKWIRENIKLSKTELKQLRLAAYPVYRDMVIDLSMLLYNNYSADYISRRLDMLQSNRRREYDTNYILPLNPNLIAYRMARATGLINRARERAMKLRAKQQSGKK